MPEELKQDFQEDIKSGTDLTADYMEQINRSFRQMLKNPTDKEIEQHRKTRDALIAAWLASFFKDIENQLYIFAQRGIDEADKQLKSKNITQIKEKNITVETYENQVKQRKTANEEDVILISQNIKTNSENVINQLVSSPIVNTLNEKKKIASDLAADLVEKGINFFYDRAGRRYSIAEYINMKVMTETINAERISFFTRAIQYGVDLVRIVHLNLHPTCELCAPFEGRILSIRGATEGYMSLEQASMQGLFHPRCDHIPEELELAPTDSGKDGEILLNDENKKRYEYNQKRGFRMF